MSFTLSAWLTQDKIREPMLDVVKIGAQGRDFEPNSELQFEKVRLWAETL